MESLADAFDRYGLAAVFTLMLVKSVGVPVPIPADAIMLATAARAAEGRIPLLPAFGAILFGVVLGSTGQYLLTRGPARGLIYRYGRYVGLSSVRLERASVTVKGSGILGIALAVALPGVRAASVAACGLASVRYQTFLSGLIVGTTAFLGLHFTLGYLGGSFAGRLIATVPLPGLLAIALLALGLALWAVIRRRRSRSSASVLAGEAFGAWQEAVCPVCLAAAAIDRRWESGESIPHHAVREETQRGV